VGITRLRLSNFKSFESLDLELGQFTVVVGANGAGKSNLISVFKFLRDISASGLDNAISLQGGVQFLRNVRLGPSVPLCIEITADSPAPPSHPLYRQRPDSDTFFSVAASRTTYRFVIEFASRGAKFSIAEEDLTQRWELQEYEQVRRRVPLEMRRTGQAEFRLCRENGRYRNTLNLPEDLADFEEALLPYGSFMPVPGGRALLLEEGPFFFVPEWTHNFASTAVYDIDPKLPKKAVPITGKAELEEDGSNLAIVVSNVIRRHESRRQLSNLIQDLLPFVDRVGVERFADTSLLFKTGESYSPGVSFPASLLSDGTIHVTALLIALFFEQKSFAIIEEPERNLHPFLISRLIGLMREAAASKQILATTHNAEVIKHAGEENVLLMRRTADGFTIAERPLDIEAVQRFLDQELGLEELYVQNFFAGLK
jgi:predicted ATPase